MMTFQTEWWSNDILYQKASGQLHCDIITFFKYTLLAITPHRDSVTAGGTVRVFHI